MERPVFSEIRGALATRRNLNSKRSACRPSGDQEFSSSSFVMTDTMNEGVSTVAEKRSEASVRELVAVVAGPRDWSDNRKSWLARAARRAGISTRQCKALWYGEIVDPTHRAARLMRDAAADRYEQIAEELGRRDPDRYRDDISAHLALAGSLRRLDSTRAA